MSTPHRTRLGYTQADLLAGDLRWERVNHPDNRARDEQAFAQMGKPELAVQYAPAHAVTVLGGGVFEALELPGECQVNSIHSQGIDRLAPGLRAEAVAPDGLIEAISVADSPTFALGVQWHPEWQVLDNPNYLKIFQAFGEACRQRAARRSQR